MTKKITSIILICALCLGISSCKDNTSENDSEANIQTTEAMVEASTSDSSSVDIAPPLTSTPLRSQKGIETYAEDLINQSFDQVSIDSLTVLENRGTSGLEDYKIHTILSWSGELSPTDSRTTIEEYSASIADMINVNCDNVSELSLIWLVPSLSGMGNVKYVKVEGFMSLTDLSFDSKFGAVPETSSSAISPSATSAQ